MKNTIIGLLAYSIIFIFCSGRSKSLYKNGLETNKSNTDSIYNVDSIVKLNEKDIITIMGVGDIMLGTDYPSTKYLPPSGTCTMLLKNVISYLRDANITFGNVEGVFAGNKGKAKYCNNPDQCYVFRMPEKYVNCLIDADFDLLSVANNHVNDFGYAGRTNSANVLNKAGIAYAGFIDSPYTILVKDSITYGFCAFAPHSGTADLLNSKLVTSIVEKLDSIVDIVIVSFHAGAEGKENQHVTRKSEYFLGHNRGNVYEFTHKAIDAGADILFGHGPHVTRAIEIYKNRFISYSLGNFCTYRRFNLSGPNGYAPMLKVFVNKKGEFIKAKAIPIYQEGEGIPRYDTLNRAIKKLQELTLSDFPENDLIIENNGNIYCNNSN